MYKLKPENSQPDLCLSGTSEMALAGFLNDQVFPEEHLPIKLAAVSRCYRAETSRVSEERGIFRYKNQFLYFLSYYLILHSFKGFMSLQK